VVSETHVIHDDDHWWTLIIEKREASLAFRAYDVCGGEILQPDPEMRRSDAESRLYFRKGWTDSSDMVVDLAEAEVFASGMLKWDGCLHFYVDSQENCTPHFCGLADARRLGALIELLYAQGEALIARWDQETAS